MESNYYIHPFLSLIERTLRYNIVALGMMCMPELQQAFVEGNPQILLAAKGKYGNHDAMVFETKKATEQFNKEMSINKSGEKIEAKLRMPLQGEARKMIIYLYDLLENSAYYPCLQRKDGFEFLRHLRNGAAHDNKFDFKGHMNNSLNEPITEIQWREMKITQDMENTEVFDLFIAPADLIVLISDISKLLKSFDEQANSL